MAKNRVAPLKSLTLPQLELMAALTGARLAKHLQESLPATEITFWSDSQIVLHWLSTTKTLKRFVARRVTEIQELTEPFKWKYCPSIDNPADLLTRGIPADQLKINDLWHFGPSWLCDRNLRPAWNCENLTVQSVLENEATVTAHLQDDANMTSENSSAEPNILNVINVQNYSCYKNLLRVTAYVLRFISNCKAKKQSRSIEPLSANEIKEAERKLLHGCQTAVFPGELSCFKSKTSRLPLVKQLRLFLDDSGYIRCGGRIHKAQAEDTAIFPNLYQRNIN